MGRVSSGNVKTLSVFAESRSSERSAVANEAPGYVDVHRTPRAPAAQKPSRVNRLLSDSLCKSVHLYNPTPYVRLCYPTPLTIALTFYHASRRLSTTQLRGQRLATHVHPARVAPDARGTPQNRDGVNGPEVPRRARVRERRRNASHVHLSNFLHGDL